MCTIRSHDGRITKGDDESWMDKIEDDVTNDSADTNSPVIEVDFTTIKPPPSTPSQIISNSPPSANTRHHCQGMITQVSILHDLEQASQ
jgi:hypothetical protein